MRLKPVDPAKMVLASLDQPIHSLPLGHWMDQRTKAQAYFSLQLDGPDWTEKSLLEEVR